MFRKIFNSKIFWGLFFIILSFLSVTIGVKDFSLLGLFYNNIDDVQIAVISRIPRLISIIVSGASLAISGLIMQTVTKNKFVSASTAGTMEWCKLGIIVCMLFLPNASSIQKMGVAFIFSFVGTAIFIKILNNMKIKNGVIAPLVGLMIGNIVGAITSFFAYKYDLVQNISSWLLGSFSLVLKGNYEILYFGIPFLIIGYIYADKFTISGMGEDFSKSLGMNYRQIVLIGLLIVAFITSTVVVSVGSIPFVGIIVPNLISIYRGDNVRNNIFINGFIGAIFVLICDILGRLLIPPYEISVSVIISILGSIIFLGIIFRRNRNE